MFAKKINCVTCEKFRLRIAQELRKTSWQLEGIWRIRKELQKIIAKRASSRVE